MRAGADLGALLSEAQLAAAHEVVAAHDAAAAAAAGGGDGRENQPDFSTPLVTSAHLQVPYSR